MAFPQLQTVNLDSLISSSLQNMGTKIVDNVIKVVPLVKVLMDEHSRKSSGGTRIFIPLMYGFNQTTTFYNMSDYIDASPQEAITAAQYKWTNLVAAITIFGEEEAANAGDARVVDFADEKIHQAELSMARQLNISGYGDGTGFFGAAPDGLSNIIFPTAVPADPAGGPVGAISAVTFPFWRNNANVAPGAFAVNGAMGTGSPDNMLRMYHLCSDGAIRTNVILSDNGVFESYQANAGVHYRTLEVAKADLGFDYIEYKKVPLVLGSRLPVGDSVLREHQLPVRDGRLVQVFQAHRLDADDFAGR